MLLNPSTSANVFVERTSEYLAEIPQASLFEIDLVTRVDPALNTAGSMFVLGNIEPHYKTSHDSMKKVLQVG
jgi:hypothetical protein